VNYQYQSSVPIIRRHSIGLPPNQHKTLPSTWNMANNDDITVLESVSNHSLQNQKPRIINERQARTRRRKLAQKRMKIVENHV